MMRSRSAKPSRSVPAALLGLVVSVAGLAVYNAGHRVVLNWSAISTAYAACGVVWIVAGLAMTVGGVWTLFSLGRHTIALWIASTAAILSGTILVAGVLSSVIPCSGPS